MSERADASFWRGRRVLLTGHTGFKGAWLAIWLERLGVELTGAALAPATEPSLFDRAGVARGCRSEIVDVRDAAALAACVRAARPQVVLHLAAQALVRSSYREPLATYATNVMGTANLLEAIRAQDGVRAVVVVTTDKVYRNVEQPLPYREQDALGGHDPYSASKAAAEIVAASYRDAFLAQRSVALATARAGNVIGGGDWADDRLIPDAIRAWGAGETLHVRRPGAVRPWQHVLEPLSAYLRLAERLCSEPARAGAYNFGPRPDEAASVESVIVRAQRAYGSGAWTVGDGSDGPHEAGWLALETARARFDLGIAPRWDIDESIERTMRWYRDFAAGVDARALCERDITAFEAAA